jgi:hypothetical protein
VTALSKAGWSGNVGLPAEACKGVAGRQSIMNTKYVILGWGSLLWHSEPDFDAWHECWEYDGPVLKVEFSRISRSRRGALTLVIDAEHGVETQVAHCLSSRREAIDVVADLRCREKTRWKDIGWINVGQKKSNFAEEPSYQIILDWAKAKIYDLVVWTGLKSNFEKETKVPFSVSGAIAYLRGLDAAGKPLAAEYVRKAPSFVDTPLRRAIQAEDWFSANLEI